MKDVGRPTFGTPESFVPGEQLWLYPNTRAASRACWQGLECEVVVKPTATWPMVLVKHKNGEELVHRMNIRRTPPGSVGKTKEGDGANSATPDVKFKPAFRPHPPLSDGDFEEPMLF